MSEDLTIDWSGPACTFSLNRPTNGNSVSLELVESFHHALDEFERAEGRALILQGTGRNFCTGVDLGDVENISDGDLLLRFVRIE